MLKKFVLIILFGISNIQASTTAKDDFIHNVKHSPALVKVFGGIVPCIMIFMSMEALTKAYEHNTSTFAIAYSIKWIAVIIGCALYKWLIKINLKKWLTSGSQKSTDYRPLTVMGN